MAPRPLSEWSKSRVLALGKSLRGRRETNDFHPRSVPAQSDCRQGRKQRSACTEEIPIEANCQWSRPREREIPACFRRPSRRRGTQFADGAKWRSSAPGSVRPGSGQTRTIAPRSLQKSPRRTDRRMALLPVHGQAGCYRGACSFPGVCARAAAAHDISKNPYSMTFISACQPGRLSHPEDLFRWWSWQNKSAPTTGSLRA